MSCPPTVPRRKTVVLKLTSLPFNAPGAVDNEVVLTVRALVSPALTG